MPVMEWETGELLRAREYAHDSSLIQCNSQAREVRCVTRVTDAFCYGLQKEADASRRRISLRRTLGGGGFSSLVSGHCMRVYPYPYPASGPQLSIFYYSARVHACAFASHLPFSSSCALSTAPFPSHLHPASLFITSLAKRSSARFSPTCVRRLH